jgi:malonate-semialdehyde dehydrogenase (acetylating)/methylmalonate-semialdehyde dehydrogenase
MHLLMSRIVVLVGTAKQWLPELIERASQMNVNGGFEKGADLYALNFTL